MTNTDHLAPVDKLNGLQTLRAVAAIGVVEAHTGVTFGTWHTFGTFGVDIFFVLSGFIMAMISQQEHNSFLVRRLTRILPPYWTFTLITYVAFKVMPSLDAASTRGIKPLIESLLFIPYKRMDGTMFPVLGSGWTLNYEICFYLIFALALLICNKRAIWIALCLLFMLMATAHLVSIGTFSAFYGNGIMTEFAAGIISYKIYSVANPSVCKHLRPLLYCAGIISICLLAWYEGTRFFNPGGSRIWFGVFSYVLLQSVTLLTRSGKDLSCRVTTLIGDSSYTLYLIHLLLLSVFKHCISHNFPLLQPTHLFGSIVVIVASVLLSVIIYKNIENPAHRYINLLILGGRTNTLRQHA